MSYHPLTWPEQCSETTAPCAVVATAGNTVAADASHIKRSKRSSTNVSRYGPAIGFSQSEYEADNCAARIKACDGLLALLIEHHPEILAGVDTRPCTERPTYQDVPSNGRCVTNWDF